MAAGNVTECKSPAVYRQAVYEYSLKQQLHPDMILELRMQRKDWIASERTGDPSGTERRRKRKNNDIIDVTDNNKRARENAPPTTTTDKTDISLTGYNECSIYHHCQIASTDAEFQLCTCERLKLRYFGKQRKNTSTVCTPKQTQNSVAGLL